MKYLIMCRSLTYAQRAERMLERAGMYAALAKAPQGITPEGCSYGVRVQEKNIQKALGLLRGSGIKTGRIYAISADGEAEEVKL